MTTAEAAAEYRYNTGLDFSMLDALDPEYLDDEADLDDERAASHEAEMMANLRGSQTYGLPRVGPFVI